MSENLYADSHELLVEDVLSTVSGTAYLVAPTVELLDTVATIYDESPDAVPDLRVLASEAVLKTFRDDFLIASQVADLVDDDRADLRSTTSPLHNTLIVSDTAVVAVVTADERVAALSDDDDTLTSDTVAHYSDLFDQAEPFTLRTPGRTRLLETLEAEFNTSMREDIQTVLDSVEALTGDADHLDAVQILLLLAARHEQLLYDISNWGEEVGVASKATFSRTKTNLEDAGLITTEKVPIDVGRPRQRLLLADEELATADISEIATVAQQLLD
jgi:hypothetical protein